jgi:hypothetical protein
MPCSYSRMMQHCMLRAATWPYKRCNLDRAVLERERAVALAPENNINRGVLASLYSGQGAQRHRNAADRRVAECFRRRFLCTPDSRRLPGHERRPARRRSRIAGSRGHQRTAPLCLRWVTGYWAISTSSRATHRQHRRASTKRSSPTRPTLRHSPGWVIWRWKPAIWISPTPLHRGDRGVGGLRQRLWQRPVPAAGHPPGGPAQSHRSGPQPLPRC